jgi:hypothetical protein
MKLIFRLNQPADIVFKYLADAGKYISVHPVITNMELRQGGDYKVYEKLKFGFIVYSFTYTATIKPYPDENKIMMLAQVNKKVTVVITYSISRDGGTTIVEDNVNIQSSWALSILIKPIFKKQHQKLFWNMDQKR